MPRSNPSRPGCRSIPARPASRVRTHGAWSAILALVGVSVFGVPAGAAPPLPATANWTTQSNQDISFYGWDVNTAGDVNGDGYSDVLVGCKNYDHPQVDNPSHTIGNGGLVRLYLGSANGVAPTPSIELRGEGESDENGQVGFSCQTAGDVNGDGFDDIIVSEPKRDTPGGGEGYEGRALLFLGGPTGVDPDTAWTFLGVSGSRAELGDCVAAAGDVNGDGYDDVLVSAQDMDLSVPNQGRVYAFYGSAGGLSTSPSWIQDGPLESGNWFGFSCRGVGDLNGDGYDDIGIAAPLINNYTGQAWIYLGGPGGIAPTSSWNYGGSGPGSVLGLSINRAGDVNGDGYADLILGESRAFLNRNGSAHLFLGGPGGPSIAPSWTVTRSDGSCFGFAAGTAGDVNGDGYSDLLVGAPDWVLDFDPLDDPNPHPGSAYLYLGSPSGPGTQPTWSATGDENNATLGRALAAAGDVNGDGFGDIIVGAPGRNNGGPLRGQAWVYHGRGTVPSTGVSWTSDGNQAGALQGSGMVSAGDVNGDGYADVLISAPLFDNGQLDEGRVTLHLGGPTGIGLAPVWSAHGGQAGAKFGQAVAGGGDVNGDGFADLLVGAPDFSNGQVGEGRAVLFLGATAPTYFTEAWSVEGNQAGAQLGKALALAGDVNGDGISDAVIGAPGYSDAFAGEGRVQLHTGSSFGLGVSPIRSWHGGAAGAGFGATLSGAGDLNGDGYSDLVVGAPDRDGAFSDEGRASVFRGGPTGVEAVAWFATDGGQAGERLGAAVGSAGDIDGDGFGELLIGSPGYTGSLAGEGRVQLWRGAPGSLSLFDEVLGGQAGAACGAGVAGGPDLDADGFCDIVVGAPGHGGGEGIVRLHLGGPAGVSDTPDWSAAPGQAGAMMGASVTTGGDVNGDGFAEIFAGAPWFDSGETDEGRAFAYYGNTGRGTPRTMSQVRLLSSNLIHALGRTDVADSFRIQSRGRNPGGRGRVRMICEARPLLTAFTGTPSATTSFQDTGAPHPSAGSSVALEATLSGLLPARAYHWRVRFITDSPFFPRTPWLTPAHNGPGETDLVTGEGLTAVGEEAPRPDLGGATRPPRVTPNPVAQRAEIRFTLLRGEEATLEVFDIQGRSVRRQALGWMAAGEQVVPFDAGARPALPPGVYFARVQAEGSPASSTRFTVLGPESR